LPFFYTAYTRPPPLHLTHHPPTRHPSKTRTTARRCLTGSPACAAALARATSRPPSSSLWRSWGPSKTGPALRGWLQSSRASECNREESRGRIRARALSVDGWRAGWIVKKGRCSLCALFWCWRGCWAAATVSRPLLLKLGAAILLAVLLGWCLTAACGWGTLRCVLTPISCAFCRGAKRAAW